MVIGFVFSCQKENIENKNDLKSDRQESVFTKNGMLVFKNLESFEKTTNMISNFDDNQRENWEDLLGFESQRRIVSKIMKEELIHDSMCYLWYKDVNVETISELEKHFTCIINT
jgi:hypothetical protein